MIALNDCLGPKVLNGLISNVENDMIEITTLPEKDVLYIDFAYSGIPEHLNIEKIVVRDKVDETKLSVSQEYESKSPLTEDDLEETFLGKDSRIRFSESQELISDIYESDYVAGSQTFGLAISVMTGKKTYSIIPPGGGNLVIPYDDIIMLRDL